MSYVACWLTVVGAILIYSALIPNSISLTEILSATWFGGAMLALHYLFHRRTTTASTTQSKE